MSGWLSFPLSGAYTKLQKATVGFDLSVHPSILVEHLGSCWKDYLKIEDFSEICGQNSSSIKI
jgi:hypothetical protein